MYTDLIRFENLPYVLLFWLACVAAHDWFIWRVNTWWSKKHPTQPRHPYSPAFTAIGVSYICLGSAFLIPPVLAGVVYLGFFVFGGVMAILHLFRWWIRQSR